MLSTDIAELKSSWRRIRAPSVPRGEIGRGYFNLMQPKGLHGHLRHERCGGIVFKVFAGRDEQRELKPDQLQRFRKLAAGMA